MKTSYVHVQTPHGRSLGFSAKLLAFEPTEVYSPEAPEDSKWGDKGDAMCFIAITYCNKKDKHFCKKTAREELASKPEEWVRCIDVPRLLHEAAKRCVHKYNHDRLMYLSDSRFNYVLKRFL